MRPFKQVEAHTRHLEQPAVLTVTFDNGSFVECVVHPTGFVRLLAWDDKEKQFTVMQDVQLSLGVEVP